MAIKLVTKDQSPWYVFSVYSVAIVRHDFKPSGREPGGFFLPRDLIRTIVASKRIKKQESFVTKGKNPNFFLPYKINLLFIPDA
jgi:hypothetical protein